VLVIFQVRRAIKGELIVDVIHRRVWVWEGKEPHAHLWHLIVRREIDGSKVKYSLSNAPESTALQPLAHMQAQRYWVERSFQDSKQQCGLDDYQVRGWLGWPHHMALVMMAMQFMLEQRLKNRQEYPLLSCTDIVELLRYFCPKGLPPKKKFSD
jgi:SRSO17 transposase